MPADPFVVHVARLRRTPGAHRHEVVVPAGVGDRRAGAGHPRRHGGPRGRRDPGRPGARGHPRRGHGHGHGLGPVAGRLPPVHGRGDRRGVGPGEGALRRGVPPPGPDDEEAYALVGDELDLGPSSGTPSSSSCRSPPCARRPAWACARSAAPTATPGTAGAAHRRIPVGLTSTCSSRSRPGPRRRACQPGPVWSPAGLDASRGGGGDLEVTDDGRPEEEDLQGQEPEPAGLQLGAGASRPAASAPSAARPRCRTWSARTAAGTRAARPSRSTELSRPAATVARRLAAAPGRRRRHGRRQGPGRDRGRRPPSRGGARHPRRARRAARPGRATPAGSSSSPCTEVIAMDEDPAQGVRRKKDSSLVRAAEPCATAGPRPW